MVTLYADGKPITWADAERVVPECLARNQRIELRNDAGLQVGLFTPTPAPWESNITQEEIERRIAGPFVTFDELKTRLSRE